MNRYFRRLAKFGKTFSSRRTQDEIPPRTNDVPDPRSKSTGHGKKTADKWNQ